MGAQQNGYFRLDVREGETFLILYGSKEGGRPVDMNELENYLKLRNINYEKMSLSSAVMENKDTTVRLNREKIYEVNESSGVFVSDDKMTVKIRFYPPSKNGGLINAEEIKGDLKAQHIKAEAKEDVINSFLQNRLYCTDYVIAEGQKVVEGSDGWIEYCFDTDPLAKPKLNEDGSVDFHALSLVHACSKDQVLAILHKEVLGQAGVNVLGELQNPRMSKKYHLRQDAIPISQKTEPSSIRR